MLSSTAHINGQLIPKYTMETLLNIKTENKGGNWQALIYTENADKIACDRVSVCTRACNNDA